MLKRLINKFSPKKEDELKIELSEAIEGDIVQFIRRKPYFFADLESKLLQKPAEEVRNEIHIGLKILDLKLPLTFSNSEDIILIPPKYEFWVYFFLAIKLVWSGKKVTLLFYKWSTKIIELIIPATKYLSYQNLKFLNIDEFNFNPAEKIQIINFSESFRGIKSTIPSFSTAYVTKNADLDYAAAYITEHAFTFAGLKKSNLKRILIDSEIFDNFSKKLARRLSNDSLTNGSTLRSKKLTEEIHQLISEAISDGADLLHGDGILENNEQPVNVILSRVQPDMRIYQKKFFGPVLLLTCVEHNTEEFNKSIKVQPSKGIVVFDNDKGDLQTLNLPKDFIYAKRSVKNKAEEIDVLEEHPSIEYFLQNLKF